MSVLFYSITVHVYDYLAHLYKDMQKYFAEALKRSTDQNTNMPNQFSSWVINVLYHFGWKHLQTFCRLEMALWLKGHSKGINRLCDILHVSCKGRCLWKSRAFKLKKKKQLKKKNKQKKPRTITLIFVTFFLFSPFLFYKWKTIIVRTLWASVDCSMTRRRFAYCPSVLPSGNTKLLVYFLFAR